jgi:hypothetical protein
VLVKFGSGRVARQWVFEVVASLLVVMLPERHLSCLRIEPGEAFDVELRGVQRIISSSNNSKMSERQAA